MTGFEMSEIKVGDVVEFKAGGPRMVVVKLFDSSGSAAAAVQWFQESDGEFRDDGIALAALVKSAD